MNDLTKYTILSIFLLFTIITILKLSKYYKENYTDNCKVDGITPFDPFGPTRTSKQTQCNRPYWMVDGKGMASINFPASQECVNGQCLCRNGYNLGPSNFDQTKNCCLSNDNMCQLNDTYYFSYDKNNLNQVYGKSNANIGDSCSTDLDCGQIQLTNDGNYPLVDYFSNLRCDNSGDRCWPYLGNQYSCDDNKNNGQCPDQYLKNSDGYCYKDSKCKSL